MSNYSSNEIPTGPTRPERKTRPIPTDPNALLTEHEVADRQARSIRTLQNQRVLGGGIPFIKLGRAVRYRLSDVVAWEEARRFHNTSEQGRRHG